MIALLARAQNTAVHHLSVDKLARGKLALDNGVEPLHPCTVLHDKETRHLKIAPIRRIQAAFKDGVQCFVTDLFIGINAHAAA